MKQILWNHYTCSLDIKLAMKLRSVFMVNGWGIEASKYMVHPKLHTRGSRLEAIMRI